MSVLKAVKIVEAEFQAAAGGYLIAPFWMETAAIVALKDRIKERIMKECLPVELFDESHADRERAALRQLAPDPLPGHLESYEHTVRIPMEDDDVFRCQVCQRPVCQRTEEDNEPRCDCP